MRLTLHGIQKQFGGKQIIAPVDIEFADGAFTTLLGPSGCGKTTLLRIISGLETPDDGDVFFDGVPVFSRESGINLPPEKRGLGFVFQDFALWPHMTAFENVAFGLRARGDTKDLRARVHKALEAVRLGELAERFPHQLSGGQQQRVAFARAIAVKPSCILFDEPLSALDALLREEMRGELKLLTQELGVTSIFVTHDQLEAMSLSDKIAVMKDGSIIQYASPEEIYASPADPFVARFVGKSDWIDDTTMVRPEKLSLTPSEDALRFDMTVTGLQYMGDSYDLTLTDGTRTWHYASRKQLAAGTKAAVYIKRENLISFSGGMNQ